MKEIRDLERKGADQEGGRSVKKNLQLIEDQSSLYYWVMDFRLN